MKNRSLVILTALAVGCMCLTGCVNVPSTKITGSIGGKPVSFQGPKDCSIAALAFTAAPDGSVSMTITGLVTRMNPEVITTTGAAQTAMIDSIGKVAIAAAAAAKP